GFCMAVDPENPDRAWVIPAESDFLRIPHEQALAVYRTEDAGQHWHPLT
ncbi:MAG TPA: glycosyl hydrolase, partial [Cytophagales bacterium]|nr:glycosyl hydrolase [Cytophagales bacterium]